MIKQVDISEIYNRDRRGKIQKDLDEFIQSGISCAEVSLKGYKSASSAKTAYRQTIKNLSLPINIISRQGHVYLLREGENA